MENIVFYRTVKTRNVDVTIANILDGIVTYTPETVPTTATPGSSTSKHSTSALKINSTSTAALTFKERKAKMISEARDKYIQKHFLKDC
jgi:ancient ubiquitous protein 1